MSDNIRVLMTPHLDTYKKNDHESGIRRVVEAYFRYLPDYGIDLVKEGETYDLHAVHAGMTGKEADVAHLHGLYWTSDYAANFWEYKANRLIVEVLQHAKQVTVPSSWVAETIQRDMRFSPVIIPHGIEISEWKDTEKHEGFVLWNKNRNVDVCDPTPMMELAQMNSTVEFVTTQLPFGFKERLKNVRPIGVVAHPIMKKYIQRSMLYLSTTKETFCIGALEAMAAGKPILGFDWGGNRELVIHGKNGYLARPNDMNDLSRGLDYCIEHQEILGANSREMAKMWNWPDAVAQVANVYRAAMETHTYAGQTSIVIPVYNYAHSVERTIKSALSQTHQPLEIIVVDDGSTDETKKTVEAIAKEYPLVRYIYKENGGVATARNRGIREARGEYICCIDADDAIHERYLEATVPTLNKEKSVGITYTGLHAITPDGEGLSSWPEGRPGSEPDYDKQLHARASDNMRGLNQIPTCCVFRKEAWERTGGYKQRYAPLGAGAEDAELWTRIMSIGYGAKKTTDAGLFLYSHLTGRVSGKHAEGVDINLIEPQWLAMHPWAKDGQHPFASKATPANNLQSHPVRQYDEPMVSIVIPVGPGHEEKVKDALDSLEAQTFRQWEVILSWDSGNLPSKEFLNSYPYIRWLDIYNSGNGNQSKGAGYSRNRGAEIARAPFLVFLDADDMILPKFLSTTIKVWNDTKSIVYTDYVNQIVTTEEDLVNNFNQENIMMFIHQTGEATIRGRSHEYDCERAIKQPNNKDFFHWCLITSLIPKKWHEAIGGFDESMETFEDVLYHWKMARFGYCYVRIDEPLVSYDLYSGTRRQRADLQTDNGREKAQKMLEYSKQVLERIETMGCSKCPTKPPPQSFNLLEQMNNLSPDQSAMLEQDNSYVMIEYIDANIGNHHVVGNITKTNYGYRGGGGKHQFLVHKDDLKAEPHRFRRVESGVQTAEIISEKSTAPPTPIASQEDPIRPSSIQQNPIPESKMTELGFDPETGLPIVGVVQEEAPIAQPAPPLPPGPPPTPTPAPVTPTITPGPPTQKIVHVPVEESTTAPITIPGLPQSQPKEPEIKSVPVPVTGMREEVDLNALPGVTIVLAAELKKLGLTTKQSILDYGFERLQEIVGIDETRAAGIIEALSIEKRGLG